MTFANRTVGGVLLVAGTSIGAAMLALPVSTGLAGFFPALVLFLVSWMLMTYTAFLILEVNLWMGPDANMITMARRTLGLPGEIFAWLSYLFLLYTLNTAYLAVGGPIFLNGIEVTTGWVPPTWIGPIPLLILFSLTVYQGTALVDRVNRILMIGMATAYALLVGLVAPEVHISLLTRVKWPLLLLGTSVVATSFGFHIIIPSLTNYLNRDVPKLIRVLLYGSIIPLIVYVIWEGLTLGIIPIEGPHGLMHGYHMGANGASLLANTLDLPSIHLLARFLLFFAIVTSFLGVSLSLWDFLSDGLKIPKTGAGRIALYLLTFVPPLAFSLTNPRAFLTAIEYAGAFGVVTLLGILPALMVWNGRYRRHMGTQAAFRTPGGRPLLIVVLALSIAVIAIELCHKLEWINVWTLLT